MDEDVLREAVYQKLRACKGVTDDQAAWEVAFHMSDWAHNIRDMLDVLDDPASISAEEIYDKLLAFCIHVPEHLHEAVNQFKRLA
ncbi:MAG: hypothetical protein QNK37_02085 [Acidobacteriota bacterium]|nr:hypothetical protein [Acidobacteriota bacterium]